MMGKDRHLPVFLKSINIQGFKSFADKIKLELGQGLCVIVGPNGCGKSNIADAVRWVVGEQSAKSLRGAKMEDVIFAGSTQRRPVGLAEVSLVFDNSTGIFPLDYAEVTVTRRVYRDGEGEYYINRVPCRLKDIHELFMDTGAGREGFSIIGQGRVEEILNAKAEERRRFIEEAAGISKYRMRKKETLKKLDDTQHNLQRLADIMTEIELQLEPLSAQAMTANHYLELCRELEKLETQCIVKEMLLVEQKLSFCREQAEKHQDELAKEIAVLAGKEATYAQIKEQQSQADELLQNQKDAAYRAEQAFAAAVHELKLQEERRLYREEEISRLHEEIAVLTDKQTQLSGRLGSWQERLAVIEQTLADERQRMAEQEKTLASLRLDSDKADLTTIKAELFEALATQADVSNKLTGMQHSLSSLELQLQQSLKEKILKEEESRQLSENIQQACCQIAVMEKQDKELAVKESDLQSEYANIALQEQELINTFQE
jgi:chromosome segregation protein